MDSSENNGTVAVTPLGVPVTVGMAIVGCWFSPDASAILIWLTRKKIAIKTIKIKEIFFIFTQIERTDYNLILMEQRIFHGPFKAEEFADCLMVHFNRGNLQVQKIGEGDSVAVQIKTRDFRTSGGQTALGITIQSFEDGIKVQVGQQAWFGVVASLGISALAALRNPLNLLHRLDDIAQDFESAQLTDEVWRVLESNAKSLGSGYELSDRLKRVTCEYCLTANDTGAPNCVACGAPLGNLQPFTCKYCGFLLYPQDRVCPNCKRPVNTR